MPRIREEKRFWVAAYFERKIIQNSLEIDATHWYDNDLNCDKKLKKDGMSWKLM